MKRLGVLFLLCLGCTPARAPQATAAASPAGPDIAPSPRAGSRIEQLASHIHILLTGDSPQSAWLAQKLPLLSSGQPAFGALIDELLNDPRFGRDIAAEAIIAEDLNGDGFEFEHPSLLQDRSDVRGRTVYYLRKPCRADDAEAVHPWWDLQSTILVCPDSHQPGHLVDKHGWYCGGLNLQSDISPFCGCGPSLMYCTKDAEQREQLIRSLNDEVRRTIAYAVDSELPMRQLFLMNETVRDGYADLFYDLWRVGSGEIKALPERPSLTIPKLAPRHQSMPGQHAGILTAPRMIYRSDSGRSRMRDFYKDLWCSSAGSIGVTTAQILALGVTDLRDGAGWKRLAAMPVCTTCHARLDYGMQFFLGYPSVYIGHVFDRKLQRHGVEHVYGRDIDDLRGDAALTPHDFVKLAVEQPEFDACRVQRVLEYVFKGQFEPEDRKAVAAGMTRDATLKTLMRLAVMRLAARELSPQPSIAPMQILRVATAVNAELLPLPPPLRAQIEEHCGDCHDADRRTLVHGSAAARSMVERMLSMIAFGAMPKGDAALSTHERVSMVRALAAVRWPDDKSQRQAMAYFDHGFEALPMHLERSMSSVIRAKAHAEPAVAASFFGKTTPEAASQEIPSLTTANLAGAALDALLSCKQAKDQAGGLGTCLERALAPNNLIGIPTGAAAGLP